MSDTIAYSEIWAVPQDRLADFFAREGFPLTGEEYRGIQLQIRVIPYDIKVLCGIEMPRCRVEISGEKEAAAKLHRRFELTFLSAGG